MRNWKPVARPTHRVGSALLLASVLAVAACTTPPAPLPPTTQAVVTAGVNLATVAAAANKTVGQVVQYGQLFCKISSTVIAVATPFLKPTSVIGQTAAIVAQACPYIAGIGQTVPTALPAGTNPATVPVVVTPAAAAIATS